MQSIKKNVNLKEVTCACFTINSNYQVCSKLIIQIDKCLAWKEAFVPIAENFIIDCIDKSYLLGLLISYKRKFLKICISYIKQSKKSANPLRLSRTRSQNSIE